MKRPLLPVFVSAILVFTAYVALVQFLPFTIEKGQNQQDTNMLRAQNYLATPSADIVLVGSSLAFRLSPRDLGPGVANLAMAGGAPATGLTLIDRSGMRPRLVLVEINLLSRDADMAAVQSLLRAPERQLRDKLRAFRTGYDPVNVLFRGLQAVMRKNEDGDVPPSSAIDRMIAEQRKSMAHPPDAEGLRRNLAQTAALVAKLKARGIQVGFFEMPIDSSLMDLPAEKDLRWEVARWFPPSHSCWLTLSLSGGTHTLDGIHLVNGDAVQVAQLVATQSRKCLEN